MIQELQQRYAQQSVAFLHQFTSAKTGENIGELFRQIASLYISEVSRFDKQNLIVRILLLFITAYLTKCEDL